jgi:hypothetical protein
MWVKRLSVVSFAGAAFGEILTGGKRSGPIVQPGYEGASHQASDRSICFDGASRPKFRSFGETRSGAARVLPERMCFLDLSEDLFTVPPLLAHLEQEDR